MGNACGWEGTNFENNCGQYKIRQVEPNITASLIENLDSGIEAIVEVNLSRRDFVADGAPHMVWDRVCSGKEKQVMGVYRLTMKIER